MARRKRITLSGPPAVWKFGGKCSCGEKVKILIKGGKELARKCDKCGWLVGSMIVAGSDKTIDDTE